MHNFNIGIDIHTVKSEGFFEFNIEIIYSTIATETRIDLIMELVFRFSGGKTIFYSMDLQWLAKFRLNIEAFNLKLVTKGPFSFTGVIFVLYFSCFSLIVWTHSKNYFVLRVGHIIVCVICQHVLLAYSIKCLVSFEFLPHWLSLLYSSPVCSIY